MFACECTVSRSYASLQVVQYGPVPCKTCGAILNPHVRVDFNSRQWTCPFCHMRNYFPAHYQGITPEVRAFLELPGPQAQVYLSYFQTDPEGAFPSAVTCLCGLHSMSC